MFTGAERIHELLGDLADALSLEGETAVGLVETGWIAMPKTTNPMMARMASGSKSVPRRSKGEHVKMKLKHF